LAGKLAGQLSYEGLAFHLEDSASFQAVARLPVAWSSKKSVLHQTISAIRSETWEAINRALLASAKQDKIESGATVRIDSTVTAALMHQPSDSALLWDAVRVMTRLLRQAAALPGAPAMAPETSSASCSKLGTRSDGKKRGPRSPRRRHSPGLGKGDYARYLERLPGYE
jgi:hypothetical protein